MFKRIAISLLAASATAYGKSVGTEQAVSTSAAAAAPAPAAPATGTTSAPISSVSRFTDAELAAAPAAPIYQFCQKPGQFVLTFDDGPNPLTTPRALQFLKQNNIKATFFVNGINYGNVETSQETIDLIRQEANEGHEIGSHTYYHKDLFEAIKEGTMETNIDKMTDTIQNIIGVKPAFFRPPCGTYNERVQKYLGASGYNIIMWGTDTRDWEFRSNPETLLDNVKAELNKQLTAPGVSPQTHSFISLMHDVHATTVDTVLPAVVEYVKSLGYEFVSLSECLGTSAYQATGNEGIANNLNGNNAVDATNVGQTMEINDSSSASSIEAKMIFSTFAVILSLFLLRH
ncbi:glycoside hydrolase/deacetylase [Piromyces finnis]|uniref:Glycoside hydrolase/deacetylase n=1 Tax=Piromyces finnis TaxID=1754191 RepID=A0A1Y1UWM4_9FUNG|nr:glycoside hydrolase/deacetylase [Piromyces finnis]|eukprot:ORX42023.1 glycoside hydrolase/deacetylase [Piromyces finnis]